jgi:hypothetical protein
MSKNIKRPSISIKEDRIAGSGEEKNDFRPGKRLGRIFADMKRKR